MRALLLDVPAGRPLRDRLTRIAQRLSARRSPLLWLLCATERDTQHVAIGAIDVTPARARVRALVADCRHVTESDADTLASLTTAQTGDDAATYARWLEVLGREAVTRRFFLAVARHVASFAEHACGSHDVRLREDVSLIYITRLLFLAFLESKGWLDGSRSFIAERFADCMLSGGRFHGRILRPLFFGTLNTRFSARAPAARALGAIPFLNGGLFARSGIEKRSRLQFPDDVIGRFLDEVLTRYRFTAREESTDWSEAAIDPEMLGKAFESLMMPAGRRATGSYYTPQPLVAHVTYGALLHALATDQTRDEIDRLLRNEAALQHDEAARLLRRLGTLRVLDPACGSGAFLVHALERIADLQIALGDARPRDAVRRSVLATSIFGVDLNPMAVWLCELRLWLSCVIDTTETDISRVTPLPNLDRNIQLGDALLGDGFERGAGARDTGALTRLRVRYARATGPRKASLARALDDEVRRHLQVSVSAELATLQARRRGMVLATRGRDLFGGRRGAVAAEREQLAHDRLRARELRTQLRALREGSPLPFSFRSHFADVAERGGFDVVLGNPPWVRPHHVSAEQRQALKQRFAVLRDATWRHGATLAGARNGFGGQADLSAAFLERALALVAAEGTVALLVPVKLWKSLAGGGVRRKLLDTGCLREVEDWSDAPALFDAAVYPSLVVAKRGERSAIRVTVHRRDLAIRWATTSIALSLDDTAGSPWLLLPPHARAAFNTLVRTGISLHAAGLGQVSLGVKTGCNAAFLVERDSDPVEPSLLRPLLRGEDVQAWRCPPSPWRIIWTHGRNGAPLQRLPPLAHMHLLPHRKELRARSDARGGRWWSLFRTEGARTDKARVIWADMAREPRAAVLHAGDASVPLNTCYVLRCKDEIDALTIATLLNSPVAACWLGAVAEPARGNYRRLFAWTVALLPVPDDWARAREVLAPLGERAMAGSALSAAELFEAACQAYRIRPASIGPLLDWHRGS